MIKVQAGMTIPKIALIIRATEVNSMIGSGTIPWVFRRNNNSVERMLMPAKWYAVALPRIKPPTTVIMT
jgi:hypothetical protein